MVGFEMESLFPDIVPTYKVEQNGEEVLSGTAEFIRERLEIEITKELNLDFIVMLQESDDEDLLIYLHTDNLEDLTQAQLNQLGKHGLVVDEDEKTHENIMRILNLKIS